MMRHFEMKRYPRERGKNYTLLLGATIQGNTVYTGIRTVQFMDILVQAFRFGQFS